MEQLFLLGRGDAVVVGDGIGQLGEAVLVSMESLIVVWLGGGIVAELEIVQRNAQRTEGKRWEQCVIQSSLPLALWTPRACHRALPVIERVANAHVVGELFPQGGFELALGLDGLQRLTQLPFSDFF